MLFLFLEGMVKKSVLVVTPFHERYVKALESLDLDIIGTMCLPPVNLNPRVFFSEMKKINSNLNLNELSMGMSSDYIDAIEFNSTYLRIGSEIFGERSK